MAKSRKFIKGRGKKINRRGGKSRKMRGGMWNPFSSDPSQQGQATGVTPSAVPITDTTNKASSNSGGITGWFSNLFKKKEDPNTSTAPRPVSTSSVSSSTLSQGQPPVSSSIMGGKRRRSKRRKY